MKNKLVALFFAAIALTCCFAVTAFAGLELDSEDISELDKVESIDECYCYGDVDKNGNVTSADARLILRASVELEELDAAAFVKADIDGDGKLTAADARLALRLAVGLDKFPEHQLEEIVIVPATCTTEGMSVKICTACVKIYAQFNTPSDKHVAGLWETETAASCIAEGKAVMRCVFCNEVMKETTISKTGHTGEWTYPEGKSCFDVVPKNRTCTVCGNYEETTENPPADGHNYFWVTIKENTCTENGLDVYRCKHCGQESKTLETKAHGHLYERSVITKEPTCTETGEKGDQCVFCEDVINITEVTALGHDYDNSHYKVTKEPTCAETGTADVICSTCGEAKEIELEVLPHDIVGEWTETVAATCDTDGLAEGNCRYCGPVTKVIAATGHTVSKWVNVKAPTCAEEGIRQGYCSVCGNEAAEEKIEMLPHTFNEKDKNGNLIVHRTSGILCKEDGEGYLLCTGCGFKKYGIIKCLGKCEAGETKVIKEATCTDAKMTVDICRYCKEEIESTKGASGKPLGHKWGEWADTKAATCSENGSREKVCTVCGEVKSEPIPATGHKAGEIYVVTEASCSEEGLATVSCTVCGTKLQTIRTDKLPHTPGKTVIESAATATGDGTCSVYCSECNEKIETKPFTRILVEGIYEIEFTEDSDVTAGGTVSFTIKNAASITFVRFAYGVDGTETDITETDGVYSFTVPADIAETDVITIRIF